MKTVELEKVCISEMENLGLFVNTLTADDKYSLLNRDSFNANNSDAVIGEKKTFF